MKKRILFVDDEAVLLELYAAALEDEADRWEVSTCNDPRQALARLERESFDVLVSDMKMPGMTGAELIREAMARHPHMSRLILSGYADQEEIADCIGATHQFLAKPCDVTALKSTLARVSGLDTFLMDERLKALVAQCGALPSFPTLYIEVMGELASAEPSVERIGQIIAADPGMTAKILQLVNSAFFGVARKISNPVEAVQLLGVGTVRSLVLSVHLFSCFDRSRLKGFSLDRLWNHSILTGTIARKIMQLEDAETAAADDAYIAGMLHDVGKLMLAANLPEPFQRALTLAAERGVPAIEAEREVFGATHAGVGAYLLGLWGLPAGIVEAVALHHSPGQSAVRGPGPLAVVHVANVLEHELNPPGSGEGRPPELEAAFLQSAGLAGRIDAWRAVALKLARGKGD
jgi:HD-like signal output (HDOD) protein